MAIGLNIKPWCTCHATGTWRQQDGYTHDRAADLWVHARCHKPSKMNYERWLTGYTQIPQVRRPLTDIYAIERRQEALDVIREELDWNELDDEEKWKNFLED